MAFNNYLEDENDKPYFTTNSLAYYYDKMEGFAKAVEGSAKALNLTKEEIEQRIALRLAEWDKNLESFDGSVEKLLSEWVDDGTLSHVIDSTLIDQKIAPLAGQLENTKRSVTDLVNVLQFGVVGDGMVDDTVNLQYVIDNFNYIYIPDGEYNFTQLFVTSHKKIVFGENVVLKSSLALNDATLGYIHISGTPFVETYRTTQAIKEMDSEVYVSLSDVTNFSEGDIVEIQQDRPYAQSSLVQTDEEHRQQLAYAILRVRSVDTVTGKVNFYEQIPYDFKLEYKPYLRKIDAVENVEIIGSNTKYDKMGVAVRGNFFHFRYAYNVKISGFNCYNGAGKAVEMHNVNRFIIKDITYSKPSTKENPFAEAIMINKSGFGFIEKCYVYYARRGIDFTNSWFCEVKDCLMMKSRFSTHGLLSKFITFTDCTVYGESKDDMAYAAFTFGNASYRFDECITLRGCKVYGGFYGIQSVQGSSGLTVENCEFNFNTNACSLSVGKSIFIKGCIFNDCGIGVSLNDIEGVRISDCRYHSLEEFISSTRSTVSIGGTTNKVIIDGIEVNEYKPQLISITTSHENPDIHINNSHFTQRNVSGNMNIGSKGTSFNNCVFNIRLRLTTSPFYVRNCIMPPWWYGSGNSAPSSDVTIINNLIKGTIPTLATDSPNRIHVQGNVSVL